MKNDKHLDSVDHEHKRAGHSKRSHVEHKPARDHRARHDHSAKPANRK